MKRKTKSRRRLNKRQKQKQTKKTRKTRKILRGGVLIPFSETSGIFGNISNSISNLYNTVVLPATPSYNPLEPIDSRISSQLLNTPTKSLSEIIA